MEACLDLHMDCDQDTWGPRTWIRMHRLTADFQGHHASASDRRALCAELRRIGCAVPCKPCALHWKQVWDKMGDELFTFTATPHGAFQMLYDIHNLWNLCLGKPFCRWADALALYGLPEDTPYQSTPLMHLMNIRAATWYTRAELIEAAARCE